MEKSACSQNENEKLADNRVCSVTKRILALDKNLTVLVLGSILLVASFIAPLIVFGVLIYLTNFSISDSGLIIASSFAIFAADALCVLFVAFVSLPLLTGSLLLARRTVLGDRPTLSVMFVPFRSSRTYFKSMLTGALVLLRVLLPVMALAGGISVAVWLVDAMSGQPIFIIISAAVFMLSLICVATFAACYAVLPLGFLENFVFMGMKIREAMRSSFALVAKNRADMIKKSMGDALHIALSLVTLGIYFIVYGGGRILVSHFVFCDKIYYEIKNV